MLNTITDRVWNRHENRSAICVIIAVLFLFMFGYFFSRLGYRSSAGWLFCFGFLLFFYGTMFLTLQKYGFVKWLKSFSKKELFYTAILVSLAEIFVISEIGRDRFIYFWDYANYWTLTITYSQYLFESPVHALKSIYTSINTQEYNHIAAALLSLPMKIMGNSFVVYTLLVFNLFLLPTFFIVSFNIRMVMKQVVQENLSNVFYLFLVFLFSPFYMPLFYGYLDSVALIPISILFVIALSAQWTKIDIIECLCIAVLLLFTVLLRRYFAFFAVGYMVSLCLMCFIRYLKNDEEVSFKICIAKFSLISLFSLLVLVVGFYGFFHNSVFNDFSLAYSAYSTGGYLDKIRITSKAMGRILFIFAGIGFIYMVWKKQKAYALFLIITLFLTAFLFFRIQSMGIHHRYLIIVPILIFYGVALSAFFNFLAKKRSFAFFKWIVLPLASLCIFFSFSPMTYPRYLKSYLPSEVYIPKIRGDISQLRLLVDTLNSIAEVNSSIYVLSSSVVLNDDILRKVYLPDLFDALPQLSLCSHVDLRDGFPVSFLDADIIVVADPVQYHLSSQNQQVIGILAKDILEDSRIRGNYTFIRSFLLDQGVIAKIYRRERPLSESQISYIKDQFDISYSDYPDLFANRIQLKDSQ